VINGEALNKLFYETSLIAEPRISA